MFVVAVAAPSAMAVTVAVIALAWLAPFKPSFLMLAVTLEKAQSHLDETLGGPGSLSALHFGY